MMGGKSLRPILAAWLLLLLLGLCHTLSINTTKSRPIPITVLSGFLGSGKTTLLQHLLNNNQGLRIAVIVNDVASVNIDSKLVSGSHSGSAAGMVELQNGCACCSLSEELLASVSELVTLSDLRGEEEAFHHIVIELSGVADPKSVRAKFQEAKLFDMPLMERVQLDTMVTIIDCSVFLKHLSSPKGANPDEMPELFYRDGMKPQQPDWTEDLPAPLLEALMAGGTGVAGKAERDNGVAELLVGQTETADIVLLNKIDLIRDEAETSDRIKEVVSALNPKGTTMETEYGNVSLDKILAVAEGKGVVEAGTVDDHKDAVHFASSSGIGHSHGHDHSNDDPDTAQQSHSHSHEHNEHDAHSHSHSHDYNEPDRTGTTHSHEHADATHSHEHDHLATCNDPDCTDPSHSHSHEHGELHAGIGSFVYRARRPFHPGRLSSFLRHMPVVRGLPSETEETVKVDPSTQEALKGLLRSKGFVWCANSNIAAFYWSHSGSSFEMQCLGRWWTTLPREHWPAELVEGLLSDFDDRDHDEGNPDVETVGDRRQEIVFIGLGMERAINQQSIAETLDKCLLDENEYNQFCSIRESEQELQRRFLSTLDVRMVTF